MKDSTKENMKKYLPLAIVLLLLVGCLGYYALSNSTNSLKESYQALYDELDIEVDKTDIEYSKEKPINTLSLVKSKVDNAEVSADIESIDPSKLGSYKVVYTLKKTDEHNQEVSKEIEKTFKVVDTNKPNIVLVEMEEETITLANGANFNPLDYIKEVSDKVDGNLEYSEKDTNTKGTYTISNKVDTSKAGEYKVVVKALDLNGNKEEAFFNVIVNAKANNTTNNTKKTTSNKPSSTPSSNSNTTTTNNNNNNNNTPAPSNPAPEQPKPQEHVHNWIHHDAVYNTVHHPATEGEQVFIITKPERSWEEVEQQPIYECKYNDERCMLEPDAYVIVGYQDVTVHRTELQEGYWTTQGGTPAWDEQVLVSGAYDECSCGARK